MVAEQRQGEDFAGIGPRHRGRYADVHVGREEACEDERVAEQKYPHHRLAPRDRKGFFVSGQVGNYSFDAGGNRDFTRACYCILRHGFIVPLSR